MRNGCTYGSLANGALPELVEVDEKLSDANSILGDQSLNTLLNVTFALEGAWGLIVALMTVLRSTHELDLIGDSSHFYLTFKL